MTLVFKISSVKSELLETVMEKEYKKAGWLNRCLGQIWNLPPELKVLHGCVMDYSEEKGSQVRKSMLSKSWTFLHQAAKSCPEGSKIFIVLLSRTAKKWSPGSPPQFGSKNRTSMDFHPDALSSILLKAIKCSRQSSSVLGKWLKGLFIQRANIV